MDRSSFQVGARYDIEYVGRNQTLASLEGALVVGTRSGPKGNECEFRRENGRLIILHPSLILRAELTAGE